MKYLIALGLVALSYVAFAKEPPAWARGGVITFTDRNGVVYTFKAEDYKIVKRGSKSKPKVIIVEKEKKESRHKLGVHLGGGPHGIKNENVNGKHKVSQRYRPVGGLSYGYEVEEGTHLGATVLSNETVTLDVEVKLD
jgi:hypothetical protein